MNEMEIPKGQSEILQQKLNGENDKLWIPHSFQKYIRPPGATLDTAGLVILKNALRKAQLKNQVLSSCFNSSILIRNNERLNMSIFTKLWIKELNRRGLHLDYN